MNSRLSLLGGTPDRAGVAGHVDEPDTPSRVRSSLARAPDYANAVGLGDTLIPLAQEMSSVAFSSRNERGQDFHRTRTRSRATFAGSGRHFPQDGSRALCACRDAALQRMRLHKRRQWGWRPRAVELLTNSPCLEVRVSTSGGAVCGRARTYTSSLTTVLSRRCIARPRLICARADTVVVLRDSFASSGYRDLHNARRLLSARANMHHLNVCGSTSAGSGGGDLERSNYGRTRHVLRCVL